MSGSAGSSLFFLVIIAVPVLLIVFQRRTMRRQTEATQRRLEPGVEVMTGGGLYGFVHSVRDDVIELETSPGVITRWDRRAIARVLTDPEIDDLDDVDDVDDVDDLDELDDEARDRDELGRDEFDDGEHNRDDLDDSGGDHGRTTGPDRG